MLSGEYADELRSHPHLSHGQSLENVRVIHRPRLAIPNTKVMQNMSTNLPGFEPLSNGRRHGPITNDIVMKLTRALGESSYLLF